ncbi:MAG TPA: sulfocyanin-like copper-binding protein [Acidimicrobiales bacterium]|jgi:uncharacterized cupredoxin-like copper-binding protein|nr:sulfocyanin-like copper-binding protein [Acidimicrobiales bacterium]
MPERFKRWALASLAALVLASCRNLQDGRASAPLSAPATNPAGTAGASSVAASRQAASLGVTEGNFSISPTSGSVAAGRITVTINNVGPSPHQLLAYRTNLPEDRLPIDAQGRVSDVSLPKVLDTNGYLHPGTQRQLTVALGPGRYVLICNLAGHYQAGMHTVLTVK